MFNTECDFTPHNFPAKAKDVDSDNSYVLRKTLLRGISEAEFRWRLYDGDEAFNYKQIMFDLEIVADKLDEMFRDDGRIRGEYRFIVRRAVRACRLLLELDWAETCADCSNLEAYLTDDLCEECQQAILAA